MNSEQLEVIKIRANAAAQGKWLVDVHYDEDGAEEGTCDIYGDNEPPIACYTNRNDAEFITHARQDVPDLIAEVERLRKALNFYCDISKFSEIAKCGFNSELSRDSGKIARQALKGESNE